ncbi:tumor necrosis factor receptor superfamily member 16 [Latimeria chalumnae]|uniref:tumor necrosis factor receptor superfamily member 16 n=1 Tax=Latimeria chalumnae TaxID=7897 RepID=UPI00313BA7E4
MDAVKLGVIFCLLLLAKVSVGGPCKSGKVSMLGECCDLCHPGFGVSVACGKTNTQCEPCKTNVTFSAESSLGAPCQPCSLCPENMKVASFCSDSQDTVCECTEGYHLPSENSSAVCLPCDACPQGFGVVERCGPQQNTVCAICPEGFFSETLSLSEVCLPCTVCGEDKKEISECKAISDALCLDKNLIIRNPQKGDMPHGRANPKRTVEGEASTNSSSLDFIPQEDTGKNIIPVYCSILAAVIVGLLAYVAYKCWNTCKQKKQLAKARAGELGTSPEGEKLHSDSGVFLDTQSLQETQQLNKVNKMEQRLYLNLPPQKQEEVEQLLGGSNNGKDWRRLAGLLGYEPERVDTFGRGQDPVHTLLTDWSTKEGGTLEALCTILGRMDRGDVVEKLYGEADISSVV